MHCGNEFAILNTQRVDMVDGNQAQWLWAIHRARRRDGLSGTPRVLTRPQPKAYKHEQLHTNINTVGRYSQRDSISGFKLLFPAPPLVNS